MKIYLSNNISDFDKFEHLFKSHDTDVSIINETIVLSMLYHDDECDEDINTLLKISYDIYGFIKSINNSSKFINPSFPQIEIKKIVLHSVSGDQIVLPNSIEIKGELFFGGGWRDPEIPLIVALICDNIFVSKAFRLFDKKLDWVNMYRIYELIKESGRMPELSISQSAFRVSANKSLISGDDARHGKIFDSTSPPKKTMTLCYAQKYIKTLMRQWVFNYITPSQDPNHQRQE